MAGDAGKSPSQYTNGPRPRTEDVERRLAGKEAGERQDHYELRECLGHDDLPRETKYSNLAHIKDFEVADPIRLHGKDPLGKHGGARRQDVYVHGDADDN